MSTTPAFPRATILGYPRIGRHRELKRAVESYWKGAIDAQQLERSAAELRAHVRSHLVELGLGAGDSSIPESFSYYDQVLDTAIAVGAIPSRYSDLVVDGSIGLDGLFTLARGDERRAPLEMTKWFDTNYHYLVPEIGPGTSFGIASRRVVDQFVEARDAGYLTRPALVGPVTLLLLSKPDESAPEGFQALDLLDGLLPVYARLLGELRDAGAEWVQLDESALVSENIEAPRELVLDAVRRAYAALADAGPRVFVSTAYASLGDALPVLASTGVGAIGVDVVHGSAQELLDWAASPAFSGDSAPAIAAGVVDGHNVWRNDLRASLGKLDSLGSALPDLSVSTATSLFHVPHTLEDEPDLDPQLKSWLAFADEKILEVTALAAALKDGEASIADQLDATDAALASRRSAPGVANGAVRTRTAELTDADFRRTPYAARASTQAEELGLPLLPTTTIGSFPQTGEIRGLRAKLSRGELTLDAYEDAIRREIDSVIDLQERIGLDVLVHGEPERNDMVQYFAEHLDGFAVTRNGWVQSYGTRCTKPSILWGDVSRPEPITVRWATYAQSRTSKPVKGMLTGPVTILAWSFVRDDQPLGESARQVALALREEIADLEASGIRIIQVDEPALRELLPLKLDAHPDYLDWSVGSFRLATAGAAAATQIHTHLCYSEFGVVIDAIRNLDADVTSIEAARSRMEVVADIESSGFDHGIGPGVYDIHSPRVPSVDEVEQDLRIALEGVRPEQLWVNPDCGLKTRAYPETVASLENLVAATGAIRERLVPSR